MKKECDQSRTNWKGHLHFRISHLFLVTAIAAVICFSLVVPTYYVYSWTRLLAWMVYSAVIIRLFVSQGRERLILLSALFCGLSYLFLVFVWLSGVHLQTSAILQSLFLRYLSETSPGGPLESVFRANGEFAFSYLFAFLGGGLAAFWTRTTE